MCLKNQVQGAISLSSLLGLIIEFGPINEFLKKCLKNQNKTVLHYIEIANRKVFFVIWDPIDSVQVN